VKKRIIRALYISVVVCALIPRANAHAQTASTGVTAWSTATNYLGIENFRCDCTLSSSSVGGPRRFTFRSEPMVLGVASDGPSYGILRRGDYISHIDGQSILTLEGARRFAGIEPGDDVNLTIKRGGRTMKVAVRASEAGSHAYSTPEASGVYVYSPGYAATPPTPAIAPGVWVQATPPPEPAVPTLPAEPAPAPVAVVAPSAPVWVPAPPEGPSGWFGFSIRCNDCGWSARRPGEAPVWESDEAPELSMVAAESPAGRAGLRAGDRLTHIDGLSILSREGARRFGGVEPGQKVRLTVRRGGSTMTKELRLGRRPEYRAVIAAETPRPPIAVRAATPPRPPAMRRELRYTGSLDNVTVEVWSPGGPSVEKIGDTMIITVGASVVRIKVDPKSKRD
jgi:hypothetical protein